jgi:death on curing protein
LIYLTPAQVLFLHSRIIDETGGAHGLRDLELLESAVARPRASFGGVDLYPDLPSKGAALFHSLAKNHPFVDGNKRTAVAATGIFLARNGRRLTATNEELERFTVQVAEGGPSHEDITLWLSSHSVED